MSENPFTGAWIETPRLVLRPFVKDDWAAFAEIASQEEVLEFLPAHDRMTRGELRDVFDWLLECYAINTVERIRKFPLPLVLKETDEVAGWCGLGPLEYDESEVELYFVVRHESWGRGLATEAARALLRYAFGVIGLERVVAVVDPRNGASIRVLRKIGMTEDGSVTCLSREHGCYEGHSRYSMTAECWRARDDT